MTDRDLRLLPKASLHTHLEGCMRPSTLTDLAQGYGIPVPQTRGYGDFGAFAGLYDAAAQCVRTEDDLRRLVREVVEDAAADGAVWVEPQVWPHYESPQLADAGRILDVALDEGRTTAARLGVGFGLMVTAIRVLPPEDAEVLAELAVSRAGDGVVSFGLAHDEVLGPPQPFARAFAVARAGGLVAAPHAGELLGPDSVRSALDDLGARRIAHGVRAVEDPALVERLAAERVCLDVCPTSNVLLGVVPSLAEHPLRQLLDAGVPCSVNTDDSLLFGPGLLEEYETARAVLGLDDEHLATVARSGIEAAAHAPAALVSGALERVEAWLAG